MAVLLPPGCHLSGRATLRAPLPGEALLTLHVSPEVAGRFLVSEAPTHLLVFRMEQRLPPNSELVQAVLRLFQEPVPKAALRRHELLSPRSDRARVTIQWLHVRQDGSNRTSLIDSRWGGQRRGGLDPTSGRATGGRRFGAGLVWATPGGGWDGGESGSPNPHPTARVSVSTWCHRLVSIHESGWKAFDVTEAVNFWQQLSRPRQPLLLQVSVQREHLGPLASSAHELVHFAAQGPAGARRGEPQLELHTLDLRDYG